MNNIQQCLFQIKKYRHTDKSQLFEGYVNDRLNKSLKVYYDSLLKSYDKILYLNNMNSKVLKQLTKNNKG